MVLSSGRDVRLSLRLRRRPAACPRARHAVREHLGGVLAEDTLEDVLLIVSELVANAVRYGTGDVELRMSFDGVRVTGEVLDEGAGFTYTPHAAAPNSVGGHGLAIVANVAERWTLDSERAQVRFEVLAAS